MSTATGRLNWPIAAAWASCTFIGWLVAVAALTGSTNGAFGFFLTAIFAQLVTLGLRWPLLHRLPASETSSDHTLSTTWSSVSAANDRELTWLLCWGSLIHVVGIALLGAGITMALGLAITLLVSEILLLRFAPPEWNHRLPPWWPNPLRPQAAQSAVKSLQPASVIQLNGAAAEEEEEEEEASESVANLSATFHGRGDDGLPSLYGWQRYEMQAGQKSQSLTIGFFPPFLIPPDCELDHEGEDDVSYEIEHITPAGARIALKRRIATLSTKGKISWHCRQKVLM